jgi:hypothetical protein
VCACRVSECVCVHTMSQPRTSFVNRYVAMAVSAAKMGARNTHMLRVLMEMESMCRPLWMTAAVAMSPG